MEINNNSQNEFLIALGYEQEQLTDRRAIVLVACREVVALIGKPFLSNNPNLN